MPAPILLDRKSASANVEGPNQITAPGSLESSTLPIVELTLKSSAEMQDRLTQYLSRPIEQWNYATLQSAYMIIAKEVLGNSSYQSNYGAGRDLCEYASDLIRENQQFGRVLSAIGTQLQGLEKSFDSLATYNNYRGPQLIEQTEGLCVSKILYVLSMTAKETGDVSYLKGILNHDRPDLAYLGYCHIAGDLYREIAPAREGNGPEIIKKLRTIVTDALKECIVKDINDVVAEFQLKDWQKERFLQCLDQQPQNLKLVMADIISRHSQSIRPGQIIFTSDKADRELRDFSTFRSYATGGLFTNFIAQDTTSTFAHYCHSQGTSPNYGTF